MNSSESESENIELILQENLSNPAETMVQAGMATWDREMAPFMKKLSQLESEARKAKVGMWTEQ